MSHGKHRHLGQHRAGETAVVGLAAPDDIARRAYELFQERGEKPECDLADWLRAENELKESRSRSQSV